MRYHRECYGPMEHSPSYPDPRIPGKPRVSTAPRACTGIDLKQSSSVNTFVPSVCSEARGRGCCCCRPNFPQKVAISPTDSIPCSALLASGHATSGHVGNRQGAHHIRCGWHADAKHGLAGQSAAQEGVFACVSPSLWCGRHHRRHQGNSRLTLSFPPCQ